LPKIVEAKKRLQLEMGNGNERENKNWQRHVNYVLPISRPQIPARNSSLVLRKIAKGNENVTRNTQRAKNGKYGVGKS